MKLRSLLIILLALVAPSSAWAQGKQFRFSTPYSGATAALTTTGYPQSSGGLFAINQSKLNFGVPFSIAYWVKSSAFPSSGTAEVLDTRSLLLPPLPGFFEGLYVAGNAGWPYAFGITASGSAACTARGQTCVRSQFITPNTWTHVCRTFDGTNAYSYINGIQRDFNAKSTGINYTASTTYWMLYAYGPFPASFNVRDMRVYSRILSQNECATLYNLGNQNLLPTSAPFTTNLVAEWKFDACNGSGCVDSTSSPANWVYDNTNPTVAITAPSAGAVSGTVTLTATCTDAVACQNVIWEVDGTPTDVQTVSPYTSSWVSTTFADGSHTITAIGTNLGNLTGTASVAVTTSQGISNHTYYYAAAGSDANVPCTTIGSPCATIQGSAINFIGGDTVAFHAGDTFAWTQSIQNGFLGPNAAQTIPQNLNSGGVAAPILVTTYGGGTCNPQGGVTTGCAFWQASGSGTACCAFFVANASNVIIEKQVITGGIPATLGISTPQAFYLRYYNAGILPYSGVIIRNNKVVDVANGVVANSNLPATLSCVIENNLIIGSTTSVTNSNGMMINGVNCSANANVMENINGHPGGFNSQTSSGIVTETSNSVAFGQTTAATTIEFDVALTGAGLVSGCGNAYPFWSYDRYNNTFAFNEAGLWYPDAAGCDSGGFDLDIGTSNSIVEYNYTHNDFGPAMSFYNSTIQQSLWQNNVARFNISENDARGGFSVQQQIFNNASNQTGSASFLYNNTYYNNGGTNACINQTGIADFGIYNNICYFNTATAGYYVDIVTGALPTATYDYNLYYSAGAGARDWISGCGLKTTLAGWQTCVGSDAHGLNTSPLLNAPGTGGTVYSSGTPVGPQPLPSGYLGTSSSPGKGNGLATIPTQTFPLDYYGNSCPGSQGGSGVSIGADGCGNP